MLVPKKLHRAAAKSFLVFGSYYLEYPTDVAMNPPRTHEYSTKLLSSKFFYT